MSSATRTCRWFDSAPGHHSQLDECHAVCGITRGLFVAPGCKIDRPSDLYGRRPFWQVFSSRVQPLANWKPGILANRAASARGRVIPNVRYGAIS